MRKRALSTNRSGRSPAPLVLLAWGVLALLHPLTHHDADHLMGGDSEHCVACAIAHAVSLPPPPPPPPTPAPVLGTASLPTCLPARTAFPLPSAPRSPPVISL